MIDPIPTVAVAPARAALQARIISFLQNEIQNRETILTMETPTESVVIDSLDILRVVIKLEDQFGIEIQLSANTPFATVGELVDALIDLIPNAPGR